MCKVLVRSTVIRIFYFSILQTNVFDWQTSLFFSAIIQSVTRLNVILATLTFNLSRTLITLTSKSLLLTYCGIPCILILFCLVYWSALFILISLFLSEHPPINKLGFQVYRHGSVTTKPHFLNSEWSHICNKTNICRALIFVRHFSLGASFWWWRPF